MERKADIACKMMLAIAHLYRRHLHSGTVAGLRYNEHDILHQLAEAGRRKGLSVSQLSGLAKVSPSSITQTVRGLVKKGLVERAPDSADRRAVRLSITEQGMDALSQGARELSSRYGGLVEHLGVEECRQLTALLQRMDRYLAQNL